MQLHFIVIAITIERPDATGTQCRDAASAAHKISERFESACLRGLDVTRRSASARQYEAGGLASVLVHTSRVRPGTIWNANCRAATAQTAGRRRVECACKVEVHVNITSCRTTGEVKEKTAPALKQNSNISAMLQNCVLGHWLLQQLANVLAYYLKHSDLLVSNHGMIPSARGAYKSKALTLRRGNLQCGCFRLAARIWGGCEKCEMEQHHPVLGRGRDESGDAGRSD